MEQLQDDDDGVVWNEVSVSTRPPLLLCCNLTCSIYWQCCSRTVDCGACPVKGGTLRSQARVVAWHEHDGGLIVRLEARNLPANIGNHVGRQGYELELVAGGSGLDLYIHLSGRSTIWLLHYFPLPVGFAAPSHLMDGACVTVAVCWLA